VFTKFVIQQIGCPDPLNALYQVPINDSDDPSKGLWPRPTKVQRFPRDWTVVLETFVR
jgi:hypothetical protein